MNSHRTVIHQGRLIDFGVETMTLANGVQLELEIVRHPGGAVVVPVNSRHEVCLLSQYRYAAGGNIWELPAGAIDAGEVPIQTAKRELREEAGLTADKWQTLGDLLPSPGFCDEVLHLYLAEGLRTVPIEHKRDEIIEVHWVGFDRAVTMARQGEIRDAKTIIGLFRSSFLIRS